MRRRSDSRTAVDNAKDLSDLDFDYYDEEEAVEDFREPINALGISANHPSLSTIRDTTSSASALVAPGAPIRNWRLEQGTHFTKYTKKDAKHITLRLDQDHARVYWDPSRPSKAFYIDDVKEIRIGEEARHYREECKCPEFLQPRWFTIVYLDTTRSKGRTKFMHLLADDLSTMNLWTGTLDKVSRERIDMMAGLLGFAEKTAKLVWQREMAKRFKSSEHSADEETMDLPGIIKLCRSLHVNCSDAIYRDYFLQANRDGSGKLNQEQFLLFVRRLKERKDIKRIFYQLVSPEQPFMDIDAFFSFLERVQGVDVQADPEHWTAVFEKSVRASKSRATPPEAGQRMRPLTMDFVGFQTFMSSSANSCYVPPRANLRHTRPLNEYFISSSHNTYLTGRQVVGESSTEAYITALQKGCRCLEIDCWNGNDKQPIVSHGRTLTTSIPFRDTIKVINQYAFYESPYPLILSLEVHCDREQQTRMAEIMIEEFGEKLVRRPLDESTVLPSPEALKGRILIKVKAAADDLDSKTLAPADAPIRRTRDRSMSSPWSRPVQLDNSIIPGGPLLSSPTSLSPPERTNAFWSPRTSGTSTNATLGSPGLISSADDSDSPHATDTEKKKKSATSKITAVLGELGVYTKGVKFNNFRGAEATTHNHVFSVNERTFRKLTESDSPAKKQLEDHNMRCLMRVYPSPSRVFSTNFEPLSHWRSGVQMAALNWQTYDIGQQLNEAMFTGGNDRTGYVLKPAALRLESPTPAAGIRPPQKQEVRFSVNIISAQQLPRPKGLSPDASINPYVEFETYCADDMGPNASGTRIVPGNGYNPEFGENINVKLVTRYPSLVFVRWSVWNSRDAQNTERAPLATFTAKLDSLQQGYRHLPLFDNNGEQYLFSTLFCKIDKKQCAVTPGETPSEPSSTISYSVESAMPGVDGYSQQNGRSFLRKLISRTPSGSKRHTKNNRFERTYSDPKDAEPDHLSRHSSTSTLEKCGT